MKSKILIILILIVIPTTVGGIELSPGIQGGMGIYLGEDENEIIPTFGLAVELPQILRNRYTLQFNLGYSLMGEYGATFRDYSLCTSVTINSSNANTPFFSYIGAGSGIHYLGWQIFYTEPFTEKTHKSSHFRIGADFHFVLGVGINLSKGFGLSTKLVLSRIFLTNQSNNTANLMIGVSFKRE